MEEEQGMRWCQRQVQMCQSTLCDLSLAFEENLEGELESISAQASPAQSDPIQAIPAQLSISQDGEAVHSPLIQHEPMTIKSLSPHHFVEN